MTFCITRKGKAPYYQLCVLKTHNLCQPLCCLMTRSLSSCRTMSNRSKAEVHVFNNLGYLLRNDLYYLITNNPCSLQRFRKYLEKTDFCEKLPRTNFFVKKIPRKFNCFVKTYLVIEFVNIFVSFSNF